MSRGYFAIGIEHTKTPQNIGTLWRSANLYGAAFLYTVGARYAKQSSDTMSSPSHIPLMHFVDLDDLKAHLPYSCPLVGVEMGDDSYRLADYTHPERACYLLGAEDHGLTLRATEMCHQLVQIETLRPQSLNVAVAGSILLHDRHVSRKEADR